ncbi:Asp23/Gls24 family envelope stress response protein [Nocardia macrotermitis]|uniref:Asp23/Gls24 family envelope stress response protein n=1 Tax=Nocardia macrotermitis TaxID=2585198 RepID=A0A7K0DAW0_9NOCA|nr:Asp23/Gls24 family envelope stress response protein [Nocardia macrotermitis]MQY22749.1 hypothetical protein [Nocardia macrotermitis]
MTSVLSGVSAVSTHAAPTVIRPAAPEVVEPGVLGAAAAQAAREITGVCADVRVEARIRRGAVELRMRLSVRYPMPVWQVSTVCRSHVLERMRSRFELPVRRLDIEMCGLVEL